MEIGAIILARLDSNRLPQKALKKVGNRTLIEIIIDKLKLQKNIIPILATSDREVDAPLIELAEKNKILSYTGSLENIALRVSKCVDYYGLKYFARINGDSPFLDSSLLAEALELLETEEYDIITNLLPRTYPYGISLEVINTETFQNAYLNFKGIQKYEEHITSYFYKNRETFKYKNINSNLEISENELMQIRLVVDTEDDFNVINKMYSINDKIFEENIETVCNLYKYITRNK
jgi:spore coat polysaccharide biosynthesis protein SpsF (cytidylyltransferase family)